MKPVGVLALQGDFAAHQRALAEAGADSVQVRSTAGLEQISGLILPGCESTTMLKLLQDEGLFQPLRGFAATNPVFGTCAGAILLARQVLAPEQSSLGLVDITIERNAYGRQLHSTVGRLEPETALVDQCGHAPYEGVFIRAPIVRRLGPNVQVLARYLGNPVLLQAGYHLLATFHPELTGDRRIHRYFIWKVHLWSQAMEQ